MNTSGQPNGGGDAQGTCPPFLKFDIKDSIQRGLAEARMFFLTPHQHAALFVIMDGDKFLMEVQPKTGERFGRTTSLAIGVLQQVDSKSERLQALLLNPTAEAADHILKTLQTVGKYTGVRLHSCLSDSLPVGKERRLLAKKKPHVIVGTPGRVNELLAGDAFESTTSARSCSTSPTTRPGGRCRSRWPRFSAAFRRRLHRQPLHRQLVADGGLTTCVCSPTIEHRLPEPVLALVRNPHGQFELVEFRKNAMNGGKPMTKEDRKNFDVVPIDMPPHLMSTFMKIMSAGPTTAEELLKIADEETAKEICRHMISSMSAFDDANPAGEQPGTSKK